MTFQNLAHLCYLQINNTINYNGIWFVFVYKERKLGSCDNIQEIF